MKRTLLLLLTAIMTTMMMAGNVTPEQALQKATHFVQNRMAWGEGPRLAPGMKPQLTLATKVSGLYVFNVQDNNGYVIVSPDDRTTAILGFSESGNIDPLNIPCNMREWLEGYAKEIEWLNAHPDIAAVAAEAPSSATRTNIAPMVTAHWDQFGVYNESCPKQGTKKTLVGCMAVAMGQVMHKWKTPAAVVNTIPAYTTASYSLSVPAIPAGTAINWASMLDRYDYYDVDSQMGGTDKGTFSDYTSEQAKAVADFLFYCGASIKMNYSSSASGSGTSYIPPALIDYFGYENTAVAISKQYYSDNAWKELIYHELANGRPVVYTASDPNSGGHGFVCDGYKTGDYYHINWGFSTLGYDGYYQIGALNPRDMKYNSSNAVAIGIQPLGTGGTLSSSAFQMNILWLRLIDYSISQNPVRPGSEVTMTVTFQNFYQNAFNKDITLVPTFDNGSGFGWSSTVARESVNLESGGIKTVSFTFKASTKEESIRYAFMYKDHNNSNKCLIRLDPLVTSNSAPATGINSLTTDPSSMVDGYWYDLSGRRVENPVKGVYIHNGKKIVVK